MAKEVMVALLYIRCNAQTAKVKLMKSLSSFVPPIELISSSKQSDDIRDCKFADLIRLLLMLESKEGGNVYQNCENNERVCLCKTKVNDGVLVVPTLNPGTNLLKKFNSSHLHLGLSWIFSHIWLLTARCCKFIGLFCVYVRPTEGEREKSECVRGSGCWQVVLSHFFASFF